MQEPLATSYDDVPYPRLAFPFTHPSHLAVIGRLLGLEPAEVATCRVLELGCAAGGNLVPLAYTLPRATWVGIDLAARQIESARAFAAAVSVTNVTLEPLDILTAAEPLAERFGQFDYIIAHGIYSWVPEPVKDALLALCRRLLAPHGIAYVSYNCYPGCQPREMLRRICQFHARRIRDPRDYAARTREFLKFLLAALPADGETYHVVLREQAAGLLAESDAVLLHDDLERDNDPRYFHNFMAHAGGHGLQYLGDAHFGQMFGLGISRAALDKIRGAGDVVAFEQYLDFLYGRALRTTLLCRVEAPLVRNLTHDAVRHLWIATAATPQSPPGEPLAAEPAALDDGQPIVFRCPNCTLSVTRALAKAALFELVAAGAKPVPSLELVARVCQRLRAGGVQGEQLDEPTVFQQLAPTLVEWFAMRLIDLHAFDPPLAARAGPRPNASRVARYQVAHGSGSAADRSAPPVDVSALAAGDDPVVGADGESFAARQPTSAPEPVRHVTNLLHRRVRLGGGLAGQVLARLDGQQDRAAIIAELTQPVLAGHAQIRIDNQLVTDPPEIQRLLAERVETCLNDFARHALLLAENP